MSTRIRMVLLNVAGQSVVGLVPATLTDHEINNAGKVSVTFSDECEVPSRAPVHAVLKRLVSAFKGRSH